MVLSPVWPPRQEMEEWKGVPENEESHTNTSRHYIYIYIHIHVYMYIVLVAQITVQYEEIFQEHAYVFSRAEGK